jgi:hypothetical protein
MAEGLRNNGFKMKGLIVWIDRKIRKIEGVKSRSRMLA